MGKTLPALDAALTRFIERQHLFFVATAPDGPDGHVNLSPKGYDTFRALGPDRFVYLDLTGSGAETIAHLRENGRICVLLCAFTGKPQILRLQGTGTVHLPDDERFAELRPLFGDHPGIRSIITAELDRIATSCGYGVPLMSYEGDRRALTAWAEKKGDALPAYWEQKNATSIDGLPALG